jgi:hypothetical protein
MRALWRLGFWGISATLALGAAVWAAHSEQGAQRLAAALPAAPHTPSAAQLLAQWKEAESETRRLAETVRAWNGDRDRLTARLALLERNLDEMTDALAQMRSAALPVLPSHSTVAVAGAAAFSAGQPAPAATASASEMRSDAARTAASPQPAAAAATSPAPWPAPSSTATPLTTIHEMPTGSIATRTEFGVDLGGGTNIDTLRALWVSIRSKHASLVEGLRPVIAVRESARPGEMELRLVAGPLSNAGKAARLCGLLAGAGLICQPALFDGQRLAGVRGQ